MSTSILTKTLTAAAVLLSACGGPQLMEFVNDQPGQYRQKCQSTWAAHEKAVKQLEYLRPTLRAHLWQTTPAADADGFVPEDALMDALRAGRVKAVYVQARGGIGKTELGKAIVADTCSSVPAFRVDLKELAGKGTGSDVLVQAVAAQVQVSADDGKTLRDLLGKQRWILVVDALDEIDAAARTQLLTAVQDLRSQHPQMQLVLLGRPSVYDQYYGVQGLDAVVELPPLDCGRARSALLRYAEDAGVKSQVFAFLTAWNLDRQSTIGQQCYYPYLATYRDLQVVVRLAQKFDTSKGEMGGLQHTLSEIHEAILAERLQKELVELALEGQAVLTAIDALVGLGGYEGSEWNLSFQLQRCLQSQGGDSAKARLLCENLFQSVLLERIGGHAGEVKGAEWKFGHQALADLFVARWMEGKLAKTPGDCKVVEEQAEMIGGKEVAGYLVGRPAGSKCLAQVAQALCKASGFQKNNVSLLHKGLPVGPERRGVVQTAKDWAASHGGDECTNKTLAAL